MQKFKSTHSGPLGESIAMTEFMWRGYSAVLVPHGMPGHDMVVFVDGKPKSVEVKTRQWIARESEISRWPVDMGAKGDADFFLFVEINPGTRTHKCYLLTNEQARSINRVYNGLGTSPPHKVRALVHPGDFSVLEGN